MRKIVVTLMAVVLTSSLLASCAPLRQLVSGNSSRVSSPEPDMNAAMQQAQKTLPAFIAALQSPKSGQSGFAIKARFPYGTGNDAEYLWVSELSFAGSQFQGTLDSAPQYATDLHAGDHVTIQTPDVADWVIIGNNELLGGFTIHAMRNRLNGADKASFDAQFQFTIPDQPALP